MAMLPPDIDQRSYLDLVRQTKDLAETYTDWQAPTLERPDAGLALIRIFSRMLATVSDRVNQVPERNLLAYINLIGTQLIPPQPARVPLTFKLSEGCPVDVLVPARTQAAAPPSETDKDEVLFETEQDLLVSRTQLQAVVVLEDRDYYSDRSPHLDATLASQSEAFLAFQGSRPVAHDLFITCDEVFKIPKLTTVTIAIATDSAASALKLQEIFQTWWYWNNQEKSWQPHTQVDVQVEDTQVNITLTQLPKLLPNEVNGIKALWLRVSLVPHRREVLPEITQIQVSTSIDQCHSPKACTFNANLLDLSKDFYPFGTVPQHNDTFAIQLDSKLIKPGVAVELQAILSHAASATPDLTILWEVGNGQHWVPVDASDSEGICWREETPFNFSQATPTATLELPAPVLIADASEPEPDYWIRARIVSGLFGARGRDRKYVIYNDVTLLSQRVAAGQQNIIVESVDELEVGDVIRLQATVGELSQEEATITAKNPETKTLTLDHATRNTYASGTRILSKFVMTETAADTFDPPLMQSLTITYKFTLKRAAHYFSYNDFNYCDCQPLHVRLRQAIVAGDQIAHLDDTSQLSLGEILRFEDSHPELRQIELIDRDRQLVIFTEPLTYRHERATRLVRAFHPLTRSLNRDSAIYLGFNQPFSNRPNTLYLQVEPPDPQDVAPGIHYGVRVSNRDRVAWEYASPNGWHPLVVQDETQALEESGLVQFIGPTDFIPSSYCGQSLYWVRIRKKANAWETIPFALIYFFRWTITYQRMILYGMMRDLLMRVSRSLDFPVPPRLRSVRTNTIWATQTITLENEVLGSSNNDLNQNFVTTHAPILLEQQLEVQESRMPSEEEQRQIRQIMGSTAITPVLDEMGRVESVWIRWQEVPDFYGSTASDRHYVVDHQAGTLRFGDGQAGMVPPRGRNNIRLVRYQTGGGDRGNCPAQAIAELKTTIPYIDGVINWEAAKGGNDQESLERVKERAPQQIRHRDRAVTAQDFRDLTYEASIEVARVKVITPEMMAPDFNPLLEELWIEPQGSSPDHQPIAGNDIQVMQHEIRAGRVQVLIVPHGGEDQPTPTLALLNRVETFLRSRFVPTMKLWVTGPKWQAIHVITDIVPLSVNNADTIRIAAEQQIQRFLHPLTGGNQGQGWDFGRIPHRSDLYAILEALPGVSYVRALEIQPANLRIDQQTLIYSGRHTVTLKLPGVSE